MEKKEKVYVVIIKPKTHERVKIYSARCREDMKSSVDILLNEALDAKTKKIKK